MRVSYSAQHAAEQAHLSHRKGPRRDRLGWWKRGRGALQRAPMSALGRHRPATPALLRKRTGKLALPERLRDIMQQADTVCDLHLSSGTDKSASVHAGVKPVFGARLEDEMLARRDAGGAGATQLGCRRVAGAYVLQALLEQSPWAAVESVARAHLRSTRVVAKRRQASHRHRA
jgi:hypothetical protein